MAKRSMEEKGQITYSYKSGGDWRNLAKNLNVPEGTVYKWMAQGNNPDKRGDNFTTKVFEIYCEEMERLIETNPRVSL